MSWVSESANEASADSMRRLSPRLPVRVSLPAPPVRLTSPENPEAFHTIATYYWDKAFRDLRLTDPEKRDYVLKGIDAADRAIAIKADYMEALTYKNLLLRVRANLEKDPKLQKELLAEADRLRDRAIELQKKKTAGIGD